jgi:hypothetical protein
MSGYGRTVDMRREGGKVCFQEDLSGFGSRGCAASAYEQGGHLREGIQSHLSLEC